MRIIYITNVSMLDMVHYTMGKIGGLTQYYLFNYHSSEISSYLQFCKLIDNTKPDHGLLSE